MIVRNACPACGSTHFKKNGHTHNGKQNHQCKTCPRQFVQCCEQYLISDDKRGLIERLLVERISLRGLCRAVGVTLKWLLGFLVHCFAALPDHLHVQPVACTRDVLISNPSKTLRRNAILLQWSFLRSWVPTWEEPPCFDLSYHQMNAPV